MHCIAHRRERRVRRQVAARIGFVVLCVISSAPLSAQDTPPDRLVLGELYSQVRANPRAAAVRWLTTAAEARVAGARKPPDPVIQLGFMNYALPGFTPMPTLGMTQLQVMQMLPLGGKLSLAGRVAAATASTTAERAADVLWEIRNRSAMAFYDLYAADEALRVARESVRVLHDIEKTTEAMYRVGEGRQADVLRAQVEIARMVEDTVRMRAMRETMVLRLNTLRARDAGAPVGEVALPEFPESLPARAWLDTVSLGGRPMVRAGLDDVRAAEAAEALAGKDVWPDLQIGVQVAQRPGDAPGSTERMGSLMFGATIPVFARDRQFKARDEAAAMKQMALAELAAMRAETLGQIGEAYANLARARSLSSLYRTTVLPQAEATVASALAAYRVGTVDFLTLLDDRMTLSKYRQELFTLQADEGKAWAELEMLVGRELFNPNTSAATGTPARGGR